MKQSEINKERFPHWDINLRFIDVVDELIKTERVNSYKEISIILEQTSQDISDIKNVKKRLPVHTIRMLKKYKPEVNLDYILMGEDYEMFTNQNVKNNKCQEQHNDNERYEFFINKIAEQAEEIGRLKMQLQQKEQESTRER